MIRRSIRCLACTARRQPFCSLLLVICTLAITFALLGSFYWEFWETPSSWVKQREGHSAANDVLNEERPVVDENTHGTVVQVQRYRRPEPLQCDLQPLPSSVRQSLDYCSWNKNLQECYQILEERMKLSSSWVFLGGSDMSTLADFVSRQWPYHHNNSDEVIVKVTTRRHACQNLLYYGLSPPNYPWIPPNLSLGEGPTGYGLEHPYCADCQNCWNVLVDASNGGKSSTINDLSSNNAPQRQLQQRYIEYLVVEYARDVSLQSSITNTTQETVSYHLRLKTPQVCVVSVGLLDASIPNLPYDTFLRNVERYISLLQRACTNVIWLSIPAVVEDDSSIPQYKNCELYERNIAIMDMLVTKKFGNVFLLDIWEKTLQADHSSFLQLSDRFHSVLARLFVALMVGKEER